MKPSQCKGQLITWKDDRGFGFIKPDDGSKEIFLHISALRGAGRRPKVGDIIFYEPVSEPNGKVRAAKASIQGVVSQSSTQGVVCRSSTLPAKQKPKEQDLLKTTVSLGGAIVGLFIVLSAGMSRFNRLPASVTLSSPIASSPPAVSIPGVNCIIKGNISISTGNRLYHLPGMEDYESTVIDPIKGERWFCTQSEAIASGWRRAPK
ncbi:MAG TPA: cold shock domain-containing protein [Trichocoleus sp.]|jgi:cold shock CspA family protein